jgi:hypothetical protein
MQVGMHRCPLANKSPVSVNGVMVSTDWTNWTPMTNDELMKLRLNPVNTEEFVKKGVGMPNAASKYIGTKFSSPYSGYIFWVDYIVPTAATVNKGLPEYYVLATTDTLYTYIRGQQPFFINDQGKKFLKS